MRKSFHLMAAVAVMAFGAAVTSHAQATETVASTASADAPATIAALPSATTAAPGAQLARHTECTPDGTCYVYDDKGNVIVVIG